MMTNIKPFNPYSGNTMLPISLFTINTGKVPLKLLAAMAALESRNGKSLLAKNANNYFGMKARKNEPFVSMQTTEIINGAPRVVTAKFAKYASPADSARAYVQLLQNDRYKSALDKETLYEQLVAIVQSGYATANPETYAKGAIAAFKKIGYDVEQKIISAAGILAIIIYIFATSKKG